MNLPRIPALCRAILTAATLGLAGCSSPLVDNPAGQALGLADRDVADRQQYWRLRRGASLYVALPVDETLTPEQGRLIRDAFADRFPDTTWADERESYARALGSARQRGATYLVYPTLEFWQTRHGLADAAARRVLVTDMQRGRIELRLTVTDTGSRQLVDQAVLDGTSGWLMGGSTDDLLGAALERYIAALAD